MLNKDCFISYQQDTAEDSPCEAGACCNSRVCKVAQQEAASYQHEADKGSKSVCDSCQAVCWPDEGMESGRCEWLYLLRQNLSWPLHSTNKLLHCRR